MWHHCSCFITTNIEFTKYRPRRRSKSRQSLRSLTENTVVPSTVSDAYLHPTNIYFHPMCNEWLHPRSKHRYHFQLLLTRIPSFRTYHLRRQDIQHQHRMDPCSFPTHTTIVSIRHCCKYRPCPCPYSYDHIMCLHLDGNLHLLENALLGIDVHFHTLLRMLYAKETLVHVVTKFALTPIVIVTIALC